MENVKGLAGHRKFWLTLLTEVIMTAVCFAAGAVGLSEDMLKMLVENLPWALGVGVAGNAFEHGAAVAKAIAEAKKTPANGQ